MPTSWQLTKRNAATAQRLYAATKPKGATPSRTFCNATTKEPYTGPNWHPVREGASDHLLIKPASYRAQIERATS